MKERPLSSLAGLHGNHLVVRLFLDELSMTVLSPKSLSKALPNSANSPWYYHVSVVLYLIDPWEEEKELILLKGYIDFLS